jgi:putative aldouronate transport system substrate-binding protein
MVAASACSSDSDGKSGAAQKNADSAKQTGTDKVYDVNYLRFGYTIFPPIDGKAVDLIKERFKINVKQTVVLQADYASKLSVAMASGDVPDVLTLDDTNANFYRWVKQGAFLPLNDYIDQYPSLKSIPPYVMNQLTIDGKIYGIPAYQPSYTQSMTIRKDWLDKLGLKMPTNYEELKEVALAFTKNDPDGNGKNDTYGIAMSENINPDFNAGAYWANNAWYHKDSSGQLIPGVIGPGSKERTLVLADLYAQGAVSKDFAIINWAQVNKEFYSGKAGIFIGTPVGMIEDYYTGLLKVNPTAVVEPIPPFKGPDGVTGLTTQRGFFGFTVLSSQLAGQPEKVKHILDALELGRQFIPVDQRTPNNKDYDWMLGGQGVGYDMVNGKSVLKKGAEGSIPLFYLFQSTEYYKPWAPNDEANQYSKANYNSPEMQRFIAKIEAMNKETNKTPYQDPTVGIYSQTQATKGTELSKYIIGEQTKMISGQRPVSEWDQMVKEWMARGGADFIKEINEGLKERQKK